MKTALTLIAPIVVAMIPASPAYGYIQSHLNLSKLRKSGVSSPSLTPLAMTTGEGKQSEIGPTKAIKQAIEATKKFGATSYKARMAWEVVENIEYSYKNSPNKIENKSDAVIADDDTKTKKSETRIDIIADDATYDVVEKSVRDLKSLIDEEMAKVKDLKHMANKIKEVKKSPGDIHENKSIEAITAAQEATREYGIHSAQTVLAWEAFEEIVSGDLAP